MQQEARSEYTIRPYPEQITGGMKEGEAVCFRLGTDFVEGRIEAVVTKPGLEVGGQKIEQASANEPKYVVRDIDTQQMHVLEEKSLYPGDAKQERQSTRAVGGKKQREVRVMASSAQWQHLSTEELLVKQKELVALVTKIAAKLEETSTKLNGLNEELIIRFGDLCSSAANQEEEEEENEGGGAKTPSPSGSGSTTPTGKSPAATQKKVTKPDKLGRFATPHSARVHHLKEREEERKKEGTTFRTNTGSNKSAVKSTEPPKLRKFEHW
ncbi:hypothetical protein QOT17_008338 [Balamuthia mandrillaris]